MIVVPGKIGITVPINPSAITTTANSHQNTSIRGPTVIC
jgi:hypothetical protein